jgi:hypothetical protein
LTGSKTVVIHQSSGKEQMTESVLAKLLKRTKDRSQPGKVLEKSGWQKTSKKVLEKNE